MTEAVPGIKHPAFRDALALIRPAARSETGRYLVEGIDPVRQALVSPSRVWAVFAAPGDTPALEAACAARRAPLYVTSASLIARLEGTNYETAVTAVAAVGQRLAAPDDLLPSSPDALLLAGERIQDPRNVGVLVRTAEAAGCAALAPDLIHHHPAPGGQADTDGAASGFRTLLRVPPFRWMLLAASWALAVSTSTEKP